MLEKVFLSFHFAYVIWYSFIYFSVRSTRRYYNTKTYVFHPYELSYGSAARQN